MSRRVPAQEWWSAEEIAAAALPDMPRTKRRVNAMAERMGWRATPGGARERSGAGGGWEYCWTLFPDRARRLLLSRAAPASGAPGAPAAAAAAEPDRDAAWAWFERQPEAARAEARARLEAVAEVEALEAAVGREAAVAQVAGRRGIGARSLWRWLAGVRGVRADDRLPALAPRRGDVPAARRADIDPEFLDLVKSDYLRLERRPLTDCWRDAARIAAARGIPVAPEHAVRRRIAATVSKPTLVLCRQGVEALRRMYPAQVRDRTTLAAMEAVNADFHKFDVFVRWPGPDGAIVRPQMVAFQDLHSGRILSWRVDVSANSTAVLLAAGDMIETYGIPQHVLFDNGREFAAKALTGGAASRFRFKVKEADIMGLFAQLGCEIHWATPYRGQSKPIERIFRDMAATVSTHPALAGAWTGRSPEAKPENYGSRAVPLEQFLEVLAAGIEEQNARPGRRSAVAAGRSLAEAFDASYAVAPVRKATAEQRRLWLLGAEGLRADTNTGQIRFQDSIYWDGWCHEIAGQRVVVRFDPEDLHSGLHVYAADGRYLGHAPCLVKGQFFDMDAARTHERARRAWMAAEKAAAAAHRRYTAAELGGALMDAAPAPAEPVEARVVRPVFGTGTGPAAPAARDRPPATVSTLPQRGGDSIAKPPAVPEESGSERFRRALEIEARIEAGEPVLPAMAEWLRGYQGHPEYRAQMRLWEIYGDGMFA